MSARRIVIFIACWTSAFCVALSLDTRIARFNHNSGLAHFVEGKWWAQMIKAPGVFWFTLVVALLLFLVKQINLKPAVFLVLTGILSGANGLVKWIVGRTRPYKFPGADSLRPFSFHPFLNGVWGLFDQHNLCFPSGHECTAGALAVAIGFAWPKARWIFITLAVLVGIERVAENAHYASDVVGAVGFAVLTTSLLHWLMRNWLQPVARVQELSSVPQ